MHLEIPTHDAVGDEIAYVAVLYLLKDGFGETEPEALLALDAAANNGTSNFVVGVDALLYKVNAEPTLSAVKV